MTIPASVGREILQSASWFAVAIAVVLACFASLMLAREPATGPLKAHRDNPRYFTDGSGKAIYLTGSHTWASLQDMLPVDGDQIAFDYDAYLDFLEKYNHNFFHLWAWESTSWVARDSRNAVITPLPFARTGSGTALDGKPKFDVTRFNQAYFVRLANQSSTTSTESPR